jgi:hypothetical protein
VVAAWPALGSVGAQARYRGIVFVTRGAVMLGDKIVMAVLARRRRGPRLPRSFSLNTPRVNLTALCVEDASDMRVYANDHNGRS